MGILDRMMDKGSALAVTQSSDEPLEERDDIPVLARIKQVLKFFSGSMAGVQGERTKFAFMVNRVAVEMLEELYEVPPEIMEAYLMQFSEMLRWAATGDESSDLLPDQLRSK